VLRDRPLPLARSLGLRAARSGKNQARPDPRRGTLGVNAVLPAWLGDLTITNLEIGTSSVDLSLVAAPGGGVTVESTPRRGEIDVTCGTGPPEEDQR